MPIVPWRRWNSADLPNLNIGNGSVVVDIGSLGGDAHQDAFAAIFKKLVEDNPQLHQLDVIGIQAKRPVALYDVPGLVFPFSFRELTSRAELFATTIYESGNEGLSIQLSGDGQITLLWVKFDNPEFWLEP
jgi:hypothetical protein